MSKKLNALVLLISLAASLTGLPAAEKAFGFLSYSTMNIGDDIQALAAKQYLPKGSVPIDREFIGVFSNPQKVHTIINGWFMHTKQFCWYRPDTLAPEKSWPPSPSIAPLLISIHINEGFIPEAFTEEAVQYMKEHGPVGARDYPTLRLLQEKGIPSYFSGCLTLTLKNKFKTRDNIIYAVDVDKECLEYIKTHTDAIVIPITHSVDPRLALKLSTEQRLSLATQLLSLYMKAKCVVTPRLHATMPCLGLETPVLLIKEEYDPRFDGLKELVHHCSKEELLNGSSNFDFNNPPNNPEAYKAFRDNLVSIVENWVQEKSTYATPKHMMEETP